MASLWKKSKNLMYVLIEKNSHSAPFCLVVEDITVFFFTSFYKFQQVPPYFCDNNKYIPFLMHFKYQRIVL